MSTALGDDVDSSRIGERVVAFAGHGGLAEFAAVPADRCVPLPDGMSAIDAAAFPIAYGTSARRAFPSGAPSEGERLLVLGAAGGVGLTAVEIGTLMGAEVIAAARGAEKLEIARRAGATHLINTEEADLTRRSQGARRRRRGLRSGGVRPIYSAALRACRAEADTS